MIMENVCYRRDVMAVLNMVRRNMFGELLHCQGGYQHDLRHVKFNDGLGPYGGGVEFGEKGFSEAKWRTQHSVDRNGDLYPTHGLGPVSTMLDINRGNRMLYLTSTATQSRGLKKYILDKGGVNHPNASVDFKCGDIVSTVIKCHQGQTIMLSHDTNNPRPYSLNFRVQGTLGIWQKDARSLYIEGLSKDEHRWEKEDKYLKEFDHPLWKRFQDQAAGSGHGGMDFFIFRAFIEALKGAEPVIDVYDAVSMSVISPLSEKSIRLGSASVKIPDFTRGKWEKNKPIFGLNDQHETMTLSLLDWSIIIGYFVLSLFVGLWASKNSASDRKSFFLAGRNMPWWLLGISMVATTFSTDTPNLVTDLVRRDGVSGNWAWWAFLLTGMLTVFVYARLWHRSGVLTDIEFYELRYGGKTAAF